MVRPAPLAGTGRPEFEGDSKPCSDDKVGFHIVEVGERWCRLVLGGWRVSNRGPTPGGG